MGIKQNGPASGTPLILQYTATQACQSSTNSHYLHSLLDSLVADAIARFTLSSANYEEAVTTLLKQRFGNTQLIVNGHMNSLLTLQSMSSHQDLKGHQ